MDSLFEDIKALVPECERLKESQMAYLLNNKTPKALEARQKIISFALQQINPKLTIKKYLIDKGLSISSLQDKPSFIQVLISIVNEIKVKKNNETDISNRNRKNTIQLAELSKKFVDLTTNKNESIQDKYPILLEKYNKLLQEKSNKDNNGDKNIKSLLELRVLYDSIIGEDKVKKEPIPQKNQQLNIRKQLLFQSQIFQLKRQLLIYKEIASDKEMFVYNAHEQVQLILKQLESHIGKQNTQVIQKQARSHADKTDQVLDIIKRLKALEKYMTRGVHQNLETKDSNEFIYTSDFISSKKSKISINDVTNGNLQHLNLIHIARLELLMQKLYESLFGLYNSLNTTIQPTFSIFKPTINSKFEKTMDELLETMNSLISLSVLIPTPPFPELCKSTKASDQFTSLEILDGTKIPKSELDKLEQRLNVVFKSIKYKEERWAKEKEVLENELNYHRQMYLKYTKSVSDLVGGFEEEREEFKKSVGDIKTRICGILDGIKGLVWEENAVLEFLETTEEELLNLHNSVQSLIK